MYRQIISTALQVLTVLPLPVVDDVYGLLLEVRKVPYDDN